MKWLRKIFAWFESLKSPKVEPPKPIIPEESVPTTSPVEASKELWETEWTQTPFGKAITVTQASVSVLPVNSQQPQENQTEAENDETEQQHI